MQLALYNDTIYIKNTKEEYPIVKGLPNVKYDKNKLAWYTPCTLEMLDRLSRLVKLPPVLAAERDRLRKIQDDIDRERLKDKPVPLFEYPVKVKLFQHQIRAANMAMYQFEWN